MSRNNARLANLVRSEIARSARSLGFSEDSLSHKLAKFDRGRDEHGEDMIAQVDTRAEALGEAHDLHNYLVTHAVQFGSYPDLLAALRLLPALEHALLRLRAGIPPISPEPTLNPPLDSGLELAAKTVALWRRDGYSLVLTNGCFDLLHRGHADFLRTAKAQVAERTGLHESGLKLVVAVNSDASVRALKGEARPFNGESDRCAVVRALRGVDFAFVFDTLRTTPVVQALRPDFVVKSGEWAQGLHPEEAAACGEVGAVTILIPPQPGYSTTDVAARIRGSLTAGEVAA